MAILSDSEITELCKHTPPLIEKYIDWDWQLQPAGFDLSVHRVFALTGPGTISKARESNLVASKLECDHDEKGIYFLRQGYYIVQFREIICLPNNVMALGHARSTLIRYGATIATGVWDPGFHGPSLVGLLVSNEHGINISKDSTLMQMTFHLLNGESTGFRYNYLYEHKDDT